MYAMRIGLVKFIVPFAFAFYPVLLIVEESGVPFEILAFASAIVRLGLVIYLVSSATLVFDQRRLPAWEVVLRLGLAVGALYIDPFIHWPAFAIGIAFLIWHWFQFHETKQPSLGVAE
ncbi:MAG: hypothetical protein HN970_05325, partial [Rhodospirillaceae bacterium]|nr:hypothetical protein [Rhodospirillaceae bacterium]